MSSHIDHHLDPATLMAFSAGSLGEALSAVAAAHLEMCGRCRADLSDLDLMGSLLLDSMPTKPGERTAPPPLTGDVVPMKSAVGHRQAAAAGTGAPLSFAGRVGVDLGNVPWRRLGPGVWHHRLKLSPGVKGDLRLLKIAAGKRMPEHGHGGTELTLVLEGAYRDETGVYRCGDVQDIDGDAEHRPIADERAGCVCIVASEKPARYKSLVNRLLQPVTGI